MPEGPEVETVRRSLLPLLLGATLARPRVSALKLRTPITKKDLVDVDGAVVVELFRKGKLLGIRTASGAGLFVRLGMTGRLLVEPAKKKAALHTHVRFDLQGAGAESLGEKTELRFVDPRRFGEVVPFKDDVACALELARLGPDGLSLDDDGRAVVGARFRSTARSIKDVLLDQSVVAGVGNIYAAEACFVARLSPHRQGCSLDDDEAQRLVRAIESVLTQGVLNRGTSFSDYVDGEGKTGDNARHLHVFQREGEPCRVCGDVVVRVVQGQRSTFYCPRCQP
ncbi:MAG: bifunctional DNA-formamidopyrimidine glycosylase/DNA-(apurinic or apyrimidinic site) lyase [Deltaproteobacteria bacterium]|nr:bifunctional DNA-formamidopyrimidine glycosylase/DNA-(apurinic or apyrimidinic site) lyase [Deltaproteobacteria bacterium]